MKKYNKGDFIDSTKAYYCEVSDNSFTWKKLCYLGNNLKTSTSLDLTDKKLDSDIEGICYDSGYICYLREATIYEKTWLDKCIKEKKYINMEINIINNYLEY